MLESPLKLSSNDVELELGLHTFDMTQPLKFATSLGDIERKEHAVYDGDYEVTPDTDSVTVLETKDKLMADDVTVFKVPRWDVSNDSGTTVFIGKEQLIYGN